MTNLTVREPSDIERILNIARGFIKKGLQVGPVDLQILKPSKSRDQESKYHALIGDIAKTVEIEVPEDFDEEGVPVRYEKIKYTSEVWKAWLVDEFEQELKSMGKKLTHPGKTVLSLDGRRAITIRASTRKLRKSEASEFIEFIYMKGTEFGARFTDKSLQVYEDEMRSRGII